MLIAVASLSAGCATATPPSDRCAGFKPIRPQAKSLVPGKSDVAVISDGLTDQLLAHNKFGAKQCGWKP